MTVTRVANIKKKNIPQTVGTLETRRKHKEPKVTTVTRMAAVRRQKRRQLRGSRPPGWGGDHTMVGGGGIPRTGNVYGDYIRGI